MRLRPQQNGRIEDVYRVHLSESFLYFTGGIIIIAALLSRGR